MQLKLQLEEQVTELRSRVQELETALATIKRDHAELTEQYKVGVSVIGNGAWLLIQESKIRNQ
jgi:uncharacterized protein (DUF3084 family)